MGPMPKRLRNRVCTDCGARSPTKTGHPPVRVGRHHRWSSSSHRRPRPHAARTPSVPGCRRLRADPVLRRAKRVPDPRPQPLTRSGRKSEYGDAGRHGAACEASLDAIILFSCRYRDTGTTKGAVELTRPPAPPTCGPAPRAPSARSPRWSSRRLRRPRL